MLVLFYNWDFINFIDDISMDSETGLGECRSRGHPRRPGILSQIKKDFVEYFSTTTVHGFSYIVGGRNILEKVLWVLFIAIGVSFCTHILVNLYQQWEDNPVETTIDEVGLPIQDLPFPAITICDTNSLKMPRRNRWMFLETLLNSLSLSNPKEQMKEMYPGKYTKN